MDDPSPSQPPPEPVVLVSNRQSLPVDADQLSELAARVLRREGAAGELSLSFVTPEEIENLHVRFMSEPGPTDVLSFPMDEDGLIGDVVVCPEVAASQNEDLEAELRLLVAHGVLHLLGYEHEEEDERRVMWDRQSSYAGTTSP